MNANKKKIGSTSKVHLALRAHTLLWQKKKSRNVVVMGSSINFILFAQFAYIVLRPRYCLRSKQLTNKFAPLEFVCLLIKITFVAYCWYTSNPWVLILNDYAACKFYDIPFDFRTLKNVFIPSNREPFERAPNHKMCMLICCPLFL